MTLRGFTLILVFASILFSSCQPIAEMLINPDSIQSEHDSHNELSIDFLGQEILVSGRSSTVPSSPWGWLNQAGGQYDWDYGRSIAHDGNGSIFVVGKFKGTVNFGTTTLTGGSLSMFVAKLAENGTWEWAADVATGGYSIVGNDIKVDSSGDAYVIGHFEGNPSFGNHSLSSSGQSDVFVAKISSSGTWLWATSAQGQYEDQGNGIALDHLGSIFITGSYKDQITFGQTNLSTDNSQYELYVAKISTTGTWTWAIAGESTDQSAGKKIGCDSSGNAYLIGLFKTSISLGQDNHSSSGGIDVIVSKIDANGTWVWSKSAGGTDNDVGYDINVLANGTFLITGSFNGNAYFGSTLHAGMGSDDMFVAKMNESGNWIWSESIIGNGLSPGQSVYVDPNGNVFVIGYFTGFGIFGNNTIQSSGHTSMFLAKYASNSTLKGVTIARSSSGVHGYGITGNTNQEIFITGSIKGIATYGSQSINGGYGNVLIISHSDIDMDGVNKSIDNCIFTDVQYWSSNSSSDRDSDGCRDFDEDQDDDNDGYNDTIDDCPQGELDWNTSNVTINHDNDGCHDILEDLDDDNDQILDEFDDCQNGSIGWISTNQTDYDSDGCRDFDEDNDDDNDGINDLDDDCPKEFGNSTMDRVGCIDSDGDGYSNPSLNWSSEDGADAFPHLNDQWLDSDSDGYGDNKSGQEADDCRSILGNSTIDRLGCIDSDGDGYSDPSVGWTVNDGADAIPDNPTQWLDFDEDSFGDNINGTFPDKCFNLFGTSQYKLIVESIDGTAVATLEQHYGCPDEDGDGVEDNSDVFPSDVAEWSDLDSDGVGDNSDFFPTDPSETADSDLDGIGDNSDAFPFDENEIVDTDSDGFGDNSDDCPHTHGESNVDRVGCIDQDGDGVSDLNDDFWRDPNETTDSDGDGIGDNTDIFPSDANEWIDSDFDGYGDNNDAFPYNKSEWHDTDQDGVGDNSDIFPQDETEQFDSDLDGVGDNSDMFPEDTNESRDSDGDGVGDNADHCPDSVQGQLVDEYGCALANDNNEANDSIKSQSKESSNHWVFILPVILIVTAMLVVVGKRFLRKSKYPSDAKADEMNETKENRIDLIAENGENPVEITPLTNDVPEKSLTGVYGDDGYEWIEYPKESDSWFWRDYKSGQWIQYKPD